MSEGVLVLCTWVRSMQWSRAMPEGLTGPHVAAQSRTCTPAALQGKPQCGGAVDSGCPIPARQHVGATSRAGLCVTAK